MPQAASIGHNNPPGAIEQGQSVVDDISTWMKDNPVVQTEEQSREIKLLIDRGRAALHEIEQERVGKVAPLNLQVREINDRYKAVCNDDPKKFGLYNQIINEAKKRAQIWLDAVEAKKAAEAAEAAKKVAEAEAKAKAAAEAAKQALEEAASGALDIDVAQVTKQAQETKATFEKATRESARAERDTKVKVGGGFGNAMSLRTKETLHVTDAIAAINEMGITDVIITAILTTARAYRQATGELPEGVEAKYERVL